MGIVEIIEIVVNGNRRSRQDCCKWESSRMGSSRMGSALGSLRMASIMGSALVYLDFWRLLAEIKERKRYKYSGL